MYIKYISSVIQCCFFLLLFLLGSTSIASAETTSYRSAGWIATDGDPAYLSTSGCRVSNDDLYCSRSTTSGYANLYFSSFGNLEAFGIPQGSILTMLHMRVKGKNTVGQYIGITGSKNTMPFTTQCQKPADLWQFSLGSTPNTSEFHTSVLSNSLPACLTTENLDQENLTFRINYASGTNWSADIDNFEIAFDYTPPASSPTPTPTPSPTMIPTPTAIPTPAPFLDLPWDYKSQGLSFNDAALSINSYFDHSYPLLSSGLIEPILTVGLVNNYYARDQITTYENKKSTELSYTRHDGYDYGRKAKVNYKDPVLAAASGWATYVNTCGPCGNAIHIDHGNGYETRYYHLKDGSTYPSNPNEPKWVDQGKKIGEVGFTGNVSPAGEDGAHIHFMVVQKRNSNETFQQSIPQGLTDPFGWQSLENDPWEYYTFNYKNETRTGNKSSYLWNKKLSSLTSQIKKDESKRISVENYVLDFPLFSVSNTINLKIFSSPLVHTTIDGKELQSICTPLTVTAQNLFGDNVSGFLMPFEFIVDFSKCDISNINTDSLYIYSSSNVDAWSKEETTIDMINKKATARIDHLTQFSLMAEERDAIAPTTQATLSGAKGSDNWYRSDVTVTLNSHDNAGGLGNQYTAYEINDQRIEEYLNPLIFTSEGHYKIEFYSEDKGGNVESTKTIEFDIDKKAPEAEIRYDLSAFDTKVIGKDSSSSALVTIDNRISHTPKYTISDKAGNKLVMIADKIKLGKQVALSIKSLQYNLSSLINIDNNVFFTLVVMDNNNKLKQIDQYYTLKNDKKIFTYYSSLNNITKIYTRVPRATSYTQENKPGIILLKLETKNGTLNYSY